jgi:hypothetical protein
MKPPILCPPWREVKVITDLLEVISIHFLNRWAYDYPLDKKPLDKLFLPLLL